MRVTLRKLWVLVAGLGVWAVLGTGDVQAGLLPVKVTVTPDGDAYRYTYGVVLTSDSSLYTGDYFTIYDFAGYVDGSNEQPEGFVFSTAMTGSTPGGTVPNDDPNIPNVTWTYTGPNTDGQKGLGNFVVYSTNGSTTDGTFTSRTHRQVDGKVDSNITDTEVPVPSAGNVPEPASLALLGLALPLAGMIRWARRRPREETSA